MATTSDKSSGTQVNKKGVAQGVTLVDPKTGLPITVLDDSGIKRLAVDAQVTAVIGDISVDLDFETDSVTIGDAASGNSLSIEADGSINSNVEIDAVDGDNIAISDGTNTLVINADGSINTVTSSSITVALDAFTKIPADNAIAVGSEDGTQSGVKHALKILSTGEAVVIDPAAVTLLNDIKTKLDGTLKVDDDETQVLLSTISTLLSTGVIKVDDDETQVILTALFNLLNSGVIKVDDDDTQILLTSVFNLLNSGVLKVDDDEAQVLLTTSNTLLTAINTSLSNPLKVDDDETQTLLGTILSQLQSGGLSIGTEDGTPTGVQHVFVNNLRKMIIESHDRQNQITWLDISSKKNRRVDKIEFTSSTFPGIKAVKQFDYTLSGGDYVLNTTGNWSII